MKRNFLMLYLIVFAVACGGKGASLIENNSENNDVNNDKNNVNNDNNVIGANNLLRENNFEGTVPSLTSEEPVIQFGYDFYLNYCKRFIECRDTITVAQTAEDGIATTASCLETLVNRDHPSRWKDSLDAGRVTFDESKRPACISSLAQVSCAELGTTDANPKNFPACSGVVQGTGVAAGECRSSIDCGAHFICDSCPGECIIAPKLECGASECEINQFCNESDVCVARLGKGDICDEFAECTSPFACVSGICEEPKIVAAGKNCSDELSVCAVGYYCDDICRAYKQLGEDCSMNFCERPLFCDEANKCVRAKETGTCLNSEECISFNCINESCLAPADLCILK